MNAQSVMSDSRLTHIRELKAEVSRLKAENAVLRDERAMLEAHLDLAVTAVRDLEQLPEGGRLVIVDGWNLILGADRKAVDRDDLVKQARRHLVEHPLDRVWIVYDGPRASATVSEGGRLRVSYTGGSGPHRADRFVCDFLRVARLRGVLDRIEVRTRDRDFLRDVDGIVRR